MCSHINGLTAFPDAEWPNSNKESLPKKSPQAARSGSEQGSGAVPDLPSWLAASGPWLGVPMLRIAFVSNRVLPQFGSCPRSTITR